VAVAMTAILTGVLGAAPHAGAAHATPPRSRTGIADWRLVGHYIENSIDAGEGVATVTRPGGRAYELYRGIGSVPKDLAAEGWTHIGDPDSARGVVVDAYQGSSTARSKMFLQYVHRLVRGELYNNSFDALAPGAQWMVAGEWNTMSHLQIYPTPLLNRRTPAHGGSLALVGYIRLDHKVNDIQGCDFTSRTVLICASDDDRRTLFSNEKPLLEVVLPHPLTGHSERGHVVDLGSIPQRSTCTGTFEAEGVDYDNTTGVLRVEIIQPGACILKTTIYEYKHFHV